MNNQVVVIVGPTASGKTALSVELAKRINGEIISCDSMQIYKDMNIGTAKVTKEEMQNINHYLIDFVYPNERYTVSDFKRDSVNAIEEILKKGKKPIVVGGTGLYVDSLIYGIEYPNMEFDSNYRDMLMKKCETEEGLLDTWNEANAIDPKSMEKISQNDRKRIVRALEIYKATGKTKTELEELSRKNKPKYNFKIFGITMEREKLYDKINRRVDIMIENGLEEEVKKLIQNYKEFPTAMQGIGYKEVVQCIEGNISREEMIGKIKQESRRYAKRQITWFKRNKNIVWLDSYKNTLEENIKIIVEEL